MAANNTNQRLYKVTDGRLEDITKVFWKHELQKTAIAG